MTPKRVTVTKYSDYGPGRWEVVIVHLDGYIGGIRCDTRREALDVAKQIRRGELTQY